LCTGDPQCADRAAGAGGATVHCGPVGACVECRTDDDCGGAKPTCSGAGVCVAPEQRACGSLGLPAQAYAAAPPIAGYDFTTSFTIEAWIYPTSLPSADGFIAGHGPNTTGGAAYSLVLRSDGKPVFQIADDSASYTAVGSVALPINSWAHIAGTFDAARQTATVWVGGLPKANTPAPLSDARALPATPFTVGNSSSPAAAFQFLGLIDEVRLSKVLRYDYARNPNWFYPERHFLTTSPDDVALFHFDEASGGYALDASPSGNDARLKDAAIFDPRCIYYRCGTVNLSGGDVETAPNAALQPPGSFTLEAFVHPTDLDAINGNDTSNINIIDRALLTNNQYGYHLFIETGTKLPGFEVSCDGKYWFTAKSSYVIAKGQWTHLAGVFDLTQGRVFLYQNGVQAAHSDLLGSCTRTYDNGLPLVVGSNFHGFGRFQGFVDELRLSWTVRYSTDFQPEYTFGDAVPDTHALYHFSEMGFVLAADSSPDQNPATLVHNGTDVVFVPQCF
jgi:hypothetical protein